MIAVEIPALPTIEKKDVKTVTMATVPYSLGVSRRASTIVTPSWTTTLEYLATSCMPKAESIESRFLGLLTMNRTIPDKRGNDESKIESPPLSWRCST